MRTRIAVLASGRGSNLRALHAYFHHGPGHATGAGIALVASDQPQAGALAFAREEGIPTTILAPGPAHATELAGALAEHHVDLVVLAGYLRLVPPSVVAAFRGRMINVHPALLPAFGGRGMYGDRVHRAVLAAGVRVSGVTVHFVDEVYDRGAPIAQWPVPVFAGDTVEALAARVLRVEHLLLPRAVAAVIRGTIRLDERGHAAGTVPGAFPRAAFALDAVEDEDLANDIAAALAL
jgi:phosphoribosylglycinamide formyltransferase-1